MSLRGEKNLLWAKVRGMKASAENYGMESGNTGAEECVGTHLCAVHHVIPRTYLR